VEDPARVIPRTLEDPVDLVRVALPGDARVIHTANGWPASFTRPLGRGLVMFTTLGGPGWHRPRTDRDRPSPFAGARELPIPLASLEEFALEFTGRPEPHKFSADDLRPLLTEEIGYAVPGRGTAAAILGAFALALVGLGLGLRRSRRPELVGWLGPAAAAAAAGAFVALGAAGRRAVPPSTAAAAVVEVTPGTGEAAVSGLFAVYRPESGPLPLATTRGAVLDLDAEGLEGQVRPRVQTDTDAWHWENLSLPAGVRTGLYRDIARVGRMAAVVRFGPDGAEGRLTTPGYHSPADALAITPAREPIALRLGPDGSFAAGIDDGLPPGQFLAGTVLTDRQQRRQDVYRKLLSGTPPQHLDNRELLFAWVQPDALPFTTGTTAGREIGTALLVVPLEYEPAAADTRVTVPRAFVPYRRVAEGGLLAPTLESTFPVEMRLRFQLPPAVLPLTVEKAVLHARVRAASRRFTVAGPADGGAGPVFAAESPAEPIRVEITDERLLRPDDRGGLHLTVSVTGGTPEDPAWKIESLGMDIYGRTTAR
jgi:hypothetical protein